MGLENENDLEGDILELVNNTKRNILRFSESTSTDSRYLSLPEVQEFTRILNRCKVNRWGQISPEELAQLTESARNLFTVISNKYSFIFNGLSERDLEDIDSIICKGTISSSNNHNVHNPYLRIIYLNGLLLEKSIIDTREMVIRDLEEYIRNNPKIELREYLREFNEMLYLAFSNKRPFLNHLSSTILSRSLFQNNTEYSMPYLNSQNIKKAKEALYRSILGDRKELKA